MVQELKNDMLLYHGSYCEVQLPDLKQCARNKDFGRGFYLTTSKKQAYNFAGISTRKAKTNKILYVDQKYGFVSSFKVAFIEKLKVKIYPEADTEWLHCVVGHRKKKSFSDIIWKLKDFDVIGGKIANDNTNVTITTYIAGVFGDIGTKQADDICMSLLLPERLKDQYCFRTERSLDCLSFVESEQVWLERE